MKSALILADGAPPPEKTTPDVVLPLSTTGPSRNLRLSFDGLEAKFFQRLPPALRDLLRIASYVYGADTRISRGARSDVFAEDWPRRLTFCIPVEEINLWTRADVQESLCDTLEFLTGDSFAFRFVERSPPSANQGFLEFSANASLFRAVSCVIMLSGGADSLAATLEALQKEERPLLVSHRPTPPIDSRQQNLLIHVRTRFVTWHLPHVSMIVNRQDSAGRGKFEPSQRSRSFLFTSLGVACAALLGIDDVRLCDNGIVSINLPRLDQSYGSMLSRSTHPKYLRLAQALMRVLVARPGLTITNTLLLKTKREVMDSIVNTGYPELIQETVSCAHIEGKTKQQPHCGVCSQCIDRRFATTAASVEEHDLASRYEIDIFADAIPRPVDRLQAESYVRFAQKLEAISTPSEFLEEFPELYDCLRDGEEQASSQELYSLFRRHQQCVNDVLDRKIAEKNADLRRGILSETSLIRMVCLGVHRKDPRFAYVERLRGLLCAGLRQPFQTVKAKNERHVQDVAEGLLATATETLSREVPMLPFATVATKPDFSDKPTDPTKPPLFVEFKFVRNRRALNKTITEITSRIHIYKQQGAWSLFIVYDPATGITDDVKFLSDHTDGRTTWMGIAR